MNSQKLIDTMKKKLSHMKEQNNRDNEYLPKSISYTKLELPIHYSNLVYIEDMQIENSTYYITTNGFVSKGLKLSSPKHDKNFNMSNCIFRIYPKTYNINKDKVKEYIDSTNNIISEELNELHFKFSAEMFNNLDIIQNKFGEPVRYGDIIMLLHENSRMFVEFIPSSKNLRLSHHDSEATLFSVEPAKEIMLNDNQILKTGQPIKFKIAWFSYVDRNLFFGLRFPYINNILDNMNDDEDSQKEANNSSSNNGINNKVDETDLKIFNNDKHNSNDDSSIDQMFTVKYQNNLYDTKTKKYYQQPEIIIEENTPMKWRLSLYSTFTTNENLIVYGDFVQIFHCNTSSVLSIEINDSKIFDQQSVEYKLLNLSNIKNDDTSSMNLLHQSQFTADPIDNNDTENDNLLNLFDQSISQIDNDEDFASYNFSTSSAFKLINQTMFTNQQDVNSTWVLVNLFPSKKHQSFIRYHEDTKLDTYHMIFRIKNFRTNQILTIQQCSNINQHNLIGTKKGKKYEGYIDGSESNNGKMFKFALIDDITSNNKANSDSDILTEEYQYSLFGFTKSLKSTSYYSTRPEKNDFLYIYHIISKSYLGIVPLNDDKCHLSLVKYPDEKEVFKITPIEAKIQWEYRFLSNLLNLFNYVNSNVMKIKEDKKSQTSKVLITKILTITNFVLDNLTKFLTNLFIDKFVSEAGYNSVVKSRQILISNFGFTKVLLRHLIYNYWLSNNMDELRKLNELLGSQQLKRHCTFNQAHEITLSMFTYTRGIFDFLISYCKDNEEIKDELYSNLEIYFYFMNLIDSCLYGMIEIFKNNEKILIPLIRDCNQNDKFKNTLQTIALIYFGKNEKSTPNYNLIDLIFDFIEISKYEKDIKTTATNNVIGKDHSLTSKAISLLSREKYFELLKALVNNYHNTNILENQREIINKMLIKKKDNSDVYILKESIYINNKTNVRNIYEEPADMPPSLKELLFSIADQNPDDKIHLFVQDNEQFTIEKLFPDNNKRKIDGDTLASNIKWIIYFFPSTENLSSIIDPDEAKKREIFANKVQAFYYEVIKQLEQMEHSIDFTNRSQVNLINSFLRLLKIIFEKNSIIAVTDLSYTHINGILLSYLTRKFQLIQTNDTQNISHLIHGEMNEKKLILKQRITKCNHVQYISIAESWLNVYLVFKYFLLKRLEDPKGDSVMNSNISRIGLMGKRRSSDLMNFDYANGPINSEKCELLNSYNNNGMINGQYFNNNNNIKDDNRDYYDNKGKVKNEITFYTKDELIEANNNLLATNTNIGKFPSRTRTGFDDSSKVRTTSPDYFHTKTRSIFAEINNKAHGKRIISEDEKQSNMNEISTNIINIFKLSVKQNVAILNENFYKYYNSLHYSTKEKYELDDFIKNCVPNLDSCVDQINSLIRTFSEKKIETDKSNIAFLQLTTLNSVFKEKTDKNLNFIQNLVKVFNLSDDINMQESILDLIYVFFNQRRKFFDSVAMFNEHLSDFSNIKYNPFNNKEKIKNHFRKFYYSYEKKKQEYEVKTLNSFLTFVLTQLIHIYKKILKYWKNEFRILSLAYANKYYQNLEANELMIIKIEKILKLLLQQIAKVELPTMNKDTFFDLIESFFIIIYFIRNNADNPLFNSLITILNENGGLFNKMYYSLINDYLDKGRQLSSWYCNKQLIFFQIAHRDNMLSMKDYSQQEILSIKNKYYAALIMLITLQMIALPKTDKTLNFLQNILYKDKVLFKYDSFSSFLILLSISDIQKGSLTLDYFTIMEDLNELNKNNCDDNTISLTMTFPNSFSQLYIDIMLNVLQFIILHNSMINEVNLDEIIVDNFIYLVRHIMFNNKTSNQLKITFLKLLNYFHEIDSLNKIYLTKTRQEININTIEIPVNHYFPSPLELYPLFRKYFDAIIYEDCLPLPQQNNSNRKGFMKKKDLNKKQKKYIKRAFCLYKYFLFYFIEIEPKYFESCELYDNQKESYEWLKSLIKIVLNGGPEINYDNNNPSHEHNNNDLPFKNKEEEDNNSNKVNDKYQSQNQLQKEFMKQFYESSFFYLLHCYSFMKIEKNKAHIKSNKEIYQNEGIELSLIDHQSFTKLKAYCNDESVTIIHEDNDSNSNEKGFNKENSNIKEKQLLFSTGNNIDACIYIFNKLQRYDTIIENQDKYKHLFNNLEIKDTKEKCDKLNTFKAMLWKNSNELYSYADNETSSIIFYLLILLDSQTKMQYDEIFLTFINKIAEYISVAFCKAITHKRIKLTSFLLFIISEILRFVEENETALITYTIRKKTLREVQIMFLKTGIIEKCLDLVCQYNKPELHELLPPIFEMFCRMLKKGNSNSQETFYTLFNIKNKFEPVFLFMYEVIAKQVNEILSNKANIIRYRKKMLSYEKKLLLKKYFDTRLDSRILQFLQLLCENHNRKLQLYLHHQDNFRKCYDLVSQTQHYLNIILNNFQPFLFEALAKCFDLLIEFIQGPCLENQIALINSKILVTLHEILLCYLNCEKEVINELFIERDKERFLNEEQKAKEREKEQPKYEINLMKMTTQQLSLLSFKSSILLLALVENRTKEDNIYLILKSVVKIETIKEVYSKIFFEHLMILNDTNDLDDYCIKLHQLNRAGDVEELAKAEKFKLDLSCREPTDFNDYVILETGFFLYFLSLYYEDYDMNKEQILKKKNELSLLSKIQNYLNGGTLYDLFQSIYFFLYDFSLSILQTITYFITGCIYAGSLGRIRIYNLMRRMFKHKQYEDSDCIQFYEKYTQSIEILRNDVVYRIYFYLLPFCTSLNKFEKTRFLEEIDRTNTKTKLIEIIKFADKKKYELEYDYKVKEYASFIPLFGSLFKSVELWKDMSLLLNIAQNFFNIFAVYKVNQTYNMCMTPNDCVQIAFWRDEKSFFNLTKEDFLQIILALSYCQCSLASLIFIEFISRKIPAIFKSSREAINQKNTMQSKQNRYFSITSEFLKGFLFDFEVMYYFCYVFFAFLGTLTSDFFFSLLLLEVIQRFKTLRNVLKAIRNPYKQLIYTFSLWIILIYYFAIFGYSFFRNNFPNEKDCSSILRCVATIYYENNKMDNGIGGYLSSIYTISKGSNPFIGRFWYDELFNLLLKILVIQMISGIIIDNFAMLRTQEMDMLKDMENVCTVCGLQREEIEKIYEKYGRTYQDHLSVDHRLFNYIFYMIYLYQKDKTEFTGVESYVYELAYNQKDITWFPIEHLYTAKPGEIIVEKNDEENQ